MSASRELIGPLAKAVRHQYAPTNTINAST
jgi:hypothetical protein